MAFLGLYFDYFGEAGEIMPKNVVYNRFLVLFLLLSFLLLNLAVVPAAVCLSSASDKINPQQDNSSGSSLSLGLLSSFDFLDVENISFIIGSSQSFQTRRLIEERCVTLSSAVPCTLSFILFSDLSFHELSSLFSSNLITEFMHTKDGMI